NTLVADGTCPGGIERPCAGAAFAAEDHPAYPREIKRAERRDQRLHGKEPQPRRRCAQVGDATFRRAVLDGDAAPDMAGSDRLAVPRTKISTHEMAALGQHLIGVPVRALHRVEHLVDEGARY